MNTMPVERRKVDYKRANELIAARIECGMENSPNVLFLINQKRNLWKKYKRQNYENANVLHRLNDINKKLVKVKLPAKEKYYGRRFAHAVGSKDTWKLINEIITMGKQRSNVTISLSEIENGEVAEVFADHFATVGEKLAENIQKKKMEITTML